MTAGEKRAGAVRLSGYVNLRCMIGPRQAVLWWCDVCARDHNDNFWYRLLRRLRCAILGVTPAENGSPKSHEVNCRN
jgi:hypothetical protein